LKYRDHKNGGRKKYCEVIELLLR